MKIFKVFCCLSLIPLFFSLHPSLLANGACTSLSTTRFSWPGYLVIATEQTLGFISENSVELIDLMLDEGDSIQFWATFLSPYRNHVAMTIFNPSAGLETNYYIVVYHLSNRATTAWPLNEEDFLTGWYDSNHLMIMPPRPRVLGSTLLEINTGTRTVAFEPDAVNLPGEDSILSSLAGSGQQHWSERYSFNTRYVFYQTGTQFVLADLEETAVLWSQAVEPNIAANYAYWNPNDNIIAFRVRPPLERQENTDPDDSILMLLTLSGEETTLPYRDVMPQTIAWSPRGQRLAFYNVENVETLDADYEFHIVGIEPNLSYSLVSCIQFENRQPDFVWISEDLIAFNDYDAVRIVDVTTLESTVINLDLERFGMLGWVESLE